MSYSTVLGVCPGRRPIYLAEFRNAHGWAPSIWSRLGATVFEMGKLEELWRSIETLPEWQQTALVLTFDVGVIPFHAFSQAADELDEFDRRLPAQQGHVNHLPAMATLLRSQPQASGPQAPFIGVHGTSVTENPFDPYDYDYDTEESTPGSGLPLENLYILERHRQGTTP